MAYRDETDPRPDRDSMRVVNNESNGGAVWFIAGAVVLALIVVAFVIGNDREVGTAPVDGNVDVEVIEQTSPQAAPEAAPAEGGAAVEGSATTEPAVDPAQAPAAEPEAAPEANSAN